ncbi:MAG: NAD(P)-dependent oxidoreductase, partial [Candidatus Binatia bacterium]
RTEVVKAPSSGAELDAALGEADGLVVRTYTMVDDRLLAAAPHLRVVGRAGVGLDNVDLDACRRRGVRVVYTPDANTTAVVDYVFALILDALRPRAPLPERAPAELFHRQRLEEVGRELGGRTLGIVGMGRIGRRVARVADAFGMTVVWNDVLDASALGLGADAPGTAVAKERLWAEADVVTLHVDGRAGNRGLVDTTVLAALKPSCLLLNTARGLLVDRRALADWAKRVAPDGGRAILDVHDPEPPAADDPLWGLANVRLQAHLASRTDAALGRMSWVVRDVVRVLDGEEPESAAT